MQAVDDTILDLDNDTILDLDYGQYNHAQKIRLLQLLEEKERRINSTLIRSLYPDTGPLRRELYKPHTKFFRMGAMYRERAMISANRIGKTFGVGGYELTLHLTGQYPDWWTGKRFDRPIRAWASGTTNQTTRDILQRKLLGPVNAIGTGLIPGDCISDYKKKAGGVPDAIETVYVKHANGGISSLGFKSYEQKRKAFEGDEQDVILLDEEPPVDIYTECLTRTMTTQGIVMLLFTPLQGLSDTVLMFMPGGQIPKEASKRFVIQATWDDAPHLSEKDKQDIIDSYLPHERDARSKGIPQLGSGRIYPISEDELLVDDFQIPEHWIQAYGFDVGWKATAAVWGALNRESDVLYLHSCYKQGQELPIVHAAAIKARGEWIPGLADPAALGRGQRDGKQLMLEYNDLGLKLIPAENPVEAGMLKLYKRMTTGRLKVFKSMVQWLEEFRIYRRDEKGKVIKDFDHIMDCSRYLNMSIVNVGIIKPDSANLEIIPGASSTLTSAWAR